MLKFLKTIDWYMVVILFLMLIVGIIIIDTIFTNTYVCDGLSGIYALTIAMHTDKIQEWFN
jgi:hypothetical protein